MQFWQLWVALVLCHFSRADGYFVTKFFPGWAALVRDIPFWFETLIALFDYLGLVRTQARMAPCDNLLSCFGHLRSSYMGSSHLFSNVQVDVQDVVVLRQ